MSISPAVTSLTAPVFITWPVHNIVFLVRIFIKLRCNCFSSDSPKEIIIATSFVLDTSLSADPTDKPHITQYLTTIHNRKDITTRTQWVT